MPYQSHGTGQNGRNWSKQPLFWQNSHFSGKTATFPEIQPLSRSKMSHLARNVSFGQKCLSWPEMSQSSGFSGLPKCVKIGSFGRPLYSKEAWWTLSGHWDTAETPATASPAPACRVVGYPVYGYGGVVRTLVHARGTGPGPGPGCCFTVFFLFYRVFPCFDCLDPKNHDFDCLDPKNHDFDHFWPLLTTFSGFWTLSDRTGSRTARVPDWRPRFLVKMSEISWKSDENVTFAGIRFLGDILTKID